MKRYFPLMAVSLTITGLCLPGPFAPHAHANSGPAGPVRYFKQISFAGVTFSYGSSLASSVQGRILPRHRFLGAWRPRTVQFTFRGYIRHGYDQWTEFSVYPIRALSQNDRQAATRVQQLLRNRRNLSAIQNMPYAPWINAAQTFHAREAHMSFRNGTGIRYVTSWAQAVSPVTNSTPVLYTFQGITNDSRYLIYIQLPLYVPTLPNASPPMTAAQFNSFAKNFSQYKASIVRKINHLAAQSFIPQLQYLDTLARSIDARPVGIGG